MEKKSFIITDKKFCCSDILPLKSGEFQLSLSQDVIEAIQNSRKIMKKASEKSFKPLLEANRGFLPKSSENLDKNQQQFHLLHSCLNGIGKSLKPESIRLILACKIIELAKGSSGVSLGSISKFIEAFNLDILPYIPKKAGLFSDMYSTPLAFLISGLMGEGKIYDEESSEFIESKGVFQKNGFEPLILEENDLLGLISGSKASLALALDPVIRAQNLLKNAGLVFSVTFETLVGNHSPFFPKIHEIRNHPGQIKCSQDILSYIKKDGKNPSEMNETLFSKKGRLQDSYSFRCVCQIHGIVIETLEKTIETINKELNSVSTRPMVFSTKIMEDSDIDFTELILFGGNFSDVAIAKKLDQLCMAMNEVGSLSDRRICRINNPVYDKLSSAPEKGRSFNYVPLQSISSALVSENKYLSHPSSNDVTPFSLNKGDYYSLGALAAKKFNQLLNNVERILAIEAIVACQGLDQQRPLKGTATAEAVYEKVRQIAPPIKENCTFDIQTIEKVISLLQDQNLLNRGSE